MVNFNDNDDVDDGDVDDDGDGVKRRCCKNGDGGSGDVSGVIHRGQLGGVEKNKGNAMMMMVVTKMMMMLTMVMLMIMAQSSKM